MERLGEKQMSVLPVLSGGKHPGQVVYIAGCSVLEEVFAKEVTTYGASRSW